MLHELLNFEPHFLATFLYQVEERLNVHVGHDLDIKDFVDGFDCVDDDVELAVDFAAWVSLEQHLNELSK